MFLCGLKKSPKNISLITYLFCEENLMKNKRTSFILSVLIMSISMIAICICIIVPTIKFSDKTSGTGNTYVNKNYETNKGNVDVSNPSNDNENEAEVVVPAEKVKFFINEQTVSKTKKIVGETTLFTISFKVFMVNETSAAKTVRASAFTGDYAIDDCASFYKIDCNDEQKSKIIPSGESEDFDFSLTYVITDTEVFKDTQKHNLTINYMSEEIISSLI